MKAFSFALTAVAVLAMTGCATNKPAAKLQSHAHAHAMPSQAMANDYRKPVTHRMASQTMVYECNELGLTVHASYPNDSQVNLTIEQGGENAIFNIAPSASGSRYVSNQGLYGGGGEWHTKGSDAYFTFAGVHGDKKEAVCMLKR